MHPFLIYDRSCSIAGFHWMFYRRPNGLLYTKTYIVKYIIEKKYISMKKIIQFFSEINETFNQFFSKTISRNTESNFILTTTHPKYRTQSKSLNTQTKSSQHTQTEQHPKKNSIIQQLTSNKNIHQFPAAKRKHDSPSSKN